MSKRFINGADITLTSQSLKNKIINGGFDIWQRGTSQTSSGYASDDRWLNDNSTSTKTHSRQAFAVGQTNVPGNPEYYSRTVVNSVPGSSAFVAKYQRIESVKTLAGQTATLSFWAKADASKNIAVDFGQSFGTGGTPSARVDGIGATTIPLTTSWTYHKVTVNIPSIAGKTIGTDGNDHLEVVFWFDAGSVVNYRTNSLGNQSGTFDIAQVQLEAGSIATSFDRRTIGMEEQLCMRYYVRRTSTALNDIPFSIVGAFGSAQVLQAMFEYPYPMRKTPTFTRSGLNVANGFVGAPITSFVVTGANKTGAQLSITAASGGFAAGQAGYVYSTTVGNWFAADAEI